MARLPFRVPLDLQDQQINNVSEAVERSDVPNWGQVQDNSVVFTAKIFTVNGDYQTGDLVTQETTPGSGVYLVWILTGADQDGRVTPITAANSPGGTANQWTEFEAGGGGHVIEAPDGTDLTQRANLQFTGDVTVSDDETNNRTVVNVTGGSGGNSPFNNWTFTNTQTGTDSVPKAVIDGLVEWLPSSFYTTVGERFFTTGDTTLYPNTANRNRVYRVAASYASGTTFDNQSVTSGTLVDEGSIDRITWSPDGAGVFGSYEFRAVNGIVPGAQVGNAITNVSVTVDASAEFIHTTTFPAGLTDRTDYFFRVTGAVTGLPLGDYLAEYRENAFSGGDIWFNFRPITNGVAGAVIDFTTGGTFTGFGYTVFEEALGSTLALVNTDTDPDAVVFNVTPNNTVNFTNIPTDARGILASDEEVRQVFDRLEYEIEHIDPFTPLPHEDGYVYTADSGVPGAQPENVLTGNTRTNTTEDFYNSLGLFLDFGDPVTDVPEGSTYYIFADGTSASGMPDLVLRRNDITPTAVSGGNVLCFNVVQGFPWLEQFLAAPTPGSSTRDLNLNTQAGIDAFSSFYVRATADQSSYLERLSDGSVRWAHAQTSVRPDGQASDNDLVTEKAVRDEVIALGDIVRGFSVEQLGTLTAGTDETNRYHWFTNATLNNLSGLNGFGYLVATASTLVAANPTNEELFNAGGQFSNFTGRPITIRGVDLDFDTLALGDGDNITFQLVIVHSDGLATPTYTRFRTTTQTTSAPGLRTFEFTPSNPVLIENNETISILLTQLTAQQVTDVTGIRFSTSATEAWLNPVYPLSGPTGPINSITGDPSDTADVPKWIGTNPDGTFNLRWESDIATGGGFPDEGGLAFTRFILAADTNVFSWPSGTPNIAGQNPELWEYTAGNVISSNLSTEVAATVIYNGVDTISLGASRIDGDITISDLGTGTTITIEVIVATSSAPQAADILYRGTIAETVNQNGTYRFTATNERNTFDITQGQPIFLFLQETGTTTNFSYLVEDLRWSYTADEYVAVGGGDTQFIQHTDTPETYAGNGGAVLRVNNGAGTPNRVEFDQILNNYPSGFSLFNDIGIPSAEYVLEAVDPAFHYELPFNTIDLVADQRYNLNFPSVLDNASGFSIRGQDIRFGATTPSAIFQWDYDTNSWVEHATSATINLDNGVGASNLFQITFNAAAITQLRNSPIIETTSVDFNANSAMRRRGVALPFDVPNNDDHRQILENEHDIAANASRIDALENEVHNLEEAGTRIRAFAFHDVTIEDPSIDEVISYHSNHSGAGVFTPLPLSQTVSPAQTGSVVAGSNQLPEALARVINVHLNQVYANMIPTVDSFTRTNVGANSTFVYDGSLQFQYATLALTSDAQTFHVPLFVTSDTFGDVHHSLLDAWPVDDEITWNHIGVRWFINRPDASNSSLSLGPVPNDASRGRQQLAVPMTEAERTLYYSSTGEFATVHFTDQDGEVRNLNIDIPANVPSVIPPAPTWQDGFVYTVVTLESTDEIQPALGSNILINIGANPFQPVQSIPLSLWKANIWFGTEGNAGTTTFIVNQSQETVSWTPYTSQGQTLWFLDDININTDGTFTTGDGVITQNNPVNASNVRPGTSVNYIG